MKKAMILAALLSVAGLAGCISDSDGITDGTMDGAWADRNHDGNVVVAVVDGGVNPYHFDMLAAHMPQHLNDDPSDDVPTDIDPALWLPGHPGEDAFDSYTRLNLTLTPDDTEKNTVELYEEDAEEWAKVESSSADEVNLAWIPGTKVVGLVTFGGGDGFAASSHGVGTSSVSVGNIHGSCPHCLLVFVDGTSETSNRWVESQDWIDVQTNSWGYSAGVAVRDRFYAGSDVESQREAVERGQAIFFSAGNGLGNTFTAPNPTLFSSQEGPDWIITVGAISPEDGSSYTGHGKPADVAAIGSGYPSGGYGANTTTTAEGGFGGTSNATPVTAGMYAEALWRIRNMGGTKVQEGNVLSTGGSCGAADPDCALADGALTYQELREALYAAAEPTGAGHAVGAAGDSALPQSQNVDELDLMAQGHGSLEGKLNDHAVWESEVQRIVDIATGTIEAPAIDEDLAAWRNALSYCTQILWGEWDLGHKDVATLPAADADWPVRNWLVDDCPTEGPAIMTANALVTEAHPLY